MLLQGKVAIVTGGVTGIGKSIAIGLHEQGAKIAINHLPSQINLFNDIKEIIPDALSVPGDISKPETSQFIVDETIKKFQKIDILVSNAGICEFKDFLETDAQTYQRTVEINLNGSYFITQAVGKQMKEQGHGGSIIAISSISALVGGGKQVHYTPTKAGILSLMQSCACALGPYGIRCNAILPGTIRTQLNDEDMKDDTKRQYMEGRIPLGRLGKTDDLIGPAVFLASDLSEYVNGAQLLVDGGLFVNLQ
ncbi:L-rhamnose-1-dehydrogenase [[Candida] jaroonii]|uniref:L-rhamnose-1-dehydrogenase n=1 Tax=[Candida] jaroonii TaxID=467808 RepID=A0ACA9YFH8_9ASCO|nr:L-rhamnose-1-dehydrogenase [[Candida] jaroonii]